MNLIFKCNVSLSKKLRKVVGDDASLLISHIEDGKGVATFVTSKGEAIAQAQELIGSETSIMLTPMEVEAEAPSYDAVPNLFSDKAMYEEDLNPEAANPLKAIAETKPSLPQQRINHFEKQGEIPEAFEDLKDPTIKNHIDDVQELWEEIDRTRKAKTSDIDLEKIENIRLRAEAEETINIEEGLDKHAFIVNDTSGSISLNDIGLTFDKNIPQDVSRISAKTLYRSNDLRVLLRDNYLKLIHPDEIATYVEKQNEGQIHAGLDTYSNVDDAMDDIGKAPSQREREVGEFDEDDYMELDINEDFQTDVEQVAATMRANPRPSSRTLSGGVRRSSHGNNTQTRPSVRPKTLSGGGGPKPISKNF